MTAQARIRGNCNQGRQCLIGNLDVGTSMHYLDPCILENHLREKEPVQTFKRIVFLEDTSFLILYAFKPKTLNFKWNEKLIY